MPSTSSRKTRRRLLPPALALTALLPMGAAHADTATLDTGTYIWQGSPVAGTR